MKLKNWKNSKTSPRESDTKCRVRGNKKQTDGTLSRFAAFSFNIIRRRYNLQVVLSKYDLDSRGQCGRSMIEMLGVLAIIAVLSVGGIAGYSKAMQKYKVNKLVSEYSELIFGLLEYKQNFQESMNGGEPNLSNVVLTLNMVPPTWKLLNTRKFEDSQNNLVDIRYRVNKENTEAAVKSGIIIDISFGGVKISEEGVNTSENFNSKVCTETIKLATVQLHNTINIIMLSGAYSNKWEEVTFYGDDYCLATKRCIRDLTPVKIKNMCDQCNKERVCALTIVF